MERIKLALLIPQMRHGGAERFVSKLSGLLSEHYEVIVILFDERDMTYPLHCRYISLGLYPEESARFIHRIYKNIQRIIALKKLKNELELDVCLSLGDSANLVNVLSKGKEKIVVSIRGFQRLLQMRSGIGHWINRYVFSESDRVICVSRVMLAEFQKCFPRMKSKSTVLYNPYDFNEIKVLAEQPLDRFQELFQNHKVILSIGNYKNEKGYWHLIKAFSNVKKTISNVKLLILGKNVARNRERLIQLASELNVIQDVVLTDFVENPFQYIRRASIYVLSSVSEGFPNSLVEAMACGVPVVASDCRTGPREILSDRDCFRTAAGVEKADYGILVTPSTSGANYDSNIFEECDYDLAKAMITVLESKKVAEEFRLKALKRVQYFSFEKCKNEIMDIIKGLITL